MDREQQLQELLEEAIDIVGECHDCLAYSAPKDWWERFDKLCPDSRVWAKEETADG